MVAEVYQNGFCGLSMGLYCFTRGGFEKHGGCWRWLGVSIDIPVDDYITFQHDTTFPAIKRWLHDADYIRAIPENTYLRPLIARSSLSALLEISDCQIKKIPPPESLKVQMRTFDGTTCKSKK